MGDLKFLFTEFQKQAKNASISVREYSISSSPQLVSIKINLFKAALDFSEGFQLLSLGWIRFSGDVQLH